MNDSLAFYEAMDGKVENDILQEILWRMLLDGGDVHKKTPIRFHFSGTRLQRLAYAVLQRYASFANKRVDSGRWINTCAAYLEFHGDSDRNGSLSDPNHCRNRRN
jgi:hypothetical protein